MINLWGLITTTVLFKLAEKSKKILFLKNIPPVLITGVFLIIILKMFNLSFESYNESASFLTFLLIPATISLGYPLYKNLKMLVKNKRIIYFAFVFASICAITTTYLLAKLLKIDWDILISMLPKSVTAPIAVEISKIIGGIPELTACVVVLTGVCGAVLGHLVLKSVKVKSDIAIGLSMGATSHVIATSRCIEKGREKQVVMSTIALVVVGILTAFVIPLFLIVIK